MRKILDTTKDIHNYDALIYTVDKGNYEMTELLLDKGANVNSKDYSNATPIIHAVISGYYKFHDIGQIGDTSIDVPISM